jgi:V/A-type H+-transporting ATPase subunit I
MAKVEIIGHRDRLDATLRLLHGLRTIQLLDVTSEPGVRLPPLSADDKQLRELEELRYLRTQLDAILGMLPSPERIEQTASCSADLRELRAELEELGPELELLTHRLDELQAEQLALPRYLESLRRLLPLVPELTQLSGYETAALLIESRHAAVLGDLNTEMAAAAGDLYEIITAQVDPDTIGAILVFRRETARKVYALLGRVQVSRVRLPERFEGMPFRQALASMERRISTLPREVAETQRAITDLVEPHRGWWATQTTIYARLDQLEAIRSIGTTHHVFVAVGWVPEPDLPTLRSALEAEVGPQVMMEQIVAEPDEEPPVLLRNPSPARPFEFLVRLLSLPAYGSFDPTRLMFVFLPLFFGMMLGDIVYGLIALVLSLWVGRRFGARSPAMRDLARVLVYSSIWSLIWGVIYGEFLGNLGHQLFDLKPIWINREEAIQPLLLFALAVGAIHMTFGLLLGLWAAVRSKRRSALIERMGRLAALIGLFLLAGVASDQLPGGLMTPAVAAVVLGLVGLMYVHGWLGILIGPIEMISTFGNVLSYLRLAAIGLASVYLARVANELGAVGPIWIGVIVASLIHALNLALGIFSPTIQALRLHYVEFFGTFFESGGRAFRPFGTTAAVPPRTSSA